MGRHETWVPISGYPNYEISTLGRVRSLSRDVANRWGGTRPLEGRILQQSKVGNDGGHYCAVTLYADGVAKQVTIHVTMLETFVGPRPEGLQACHCDDDADNNALKNLYWGTPTQNARDKVANGRCAKANITHCPQQHEYTEENTYIVPSTGHRMCRACIKARNKGNANASRTHCPQEHEYTEENTYRPPGTNRRVCKTCTRDRSREHQRKRRGNI